MPQVRRAAAPAPAVDSSVRFARATTSASATPSTTSKRLLRLVAIAMTIAPAAACGGNCDGSLPGGTITVALSRTTSTGTGQLDLCIDHTCGSFDVAQALQTGLWLIDDPDPQPFALTPQQPGVVVVSIGRDRPKLVSATLRQGDDAIKSQQVLQLDRTDHGSCHRPTYSTTVPFDLRTGSFATP